MNGKYTEQVQFVPFSNLFWELMNMVKAYICIIETETEDKWKKSMTKSGQQITFQMTLKAKSMSEIIWYCLSEVLITHAILNIYTGIKGLWLISDFLHK